MRILSIHVYKWIEDNSALLCCGHEVNFAGYFERKVLRDLLNANARLAVDRSHPGDRQAINLEGDKGTAYVAVHPNKLAVSVITDAEYPQRVAFGLIQEILDDLQQLPVNYDTIDRDTQIAYPQL